MNAAPPTRHPPAASAAALRRAPEPPEPEPFLDYDKSLACVHCGLCLSSCPTYLETGNENDSPRGRIYLMRAVQDGRLPLAESTVRHIDLCLGCRACEAACPSGVRYGELLESTREHIEHRYQRGAWATFLRRVAIERIFPHPARVELALRLARPAKRLQRWLPQFARDALALIPDTLEATSLPELSPATAPRRGRVGFIQGCVMSVMFGATHAASIRLLNRAGWDVVTPPTQGCCGALHAHGGNLEAARAAARVNVAAFESLGLEAIVINAAGCGSTLKEYDHLLAGDPAWAARAIAFAGKVRDLSEWLVSSLPLDTFPGPQPRVTFHDACHLAHAQRVTQAPRDLVRAVAGQQLVELPESDVCCGSAGSYNLTEPAMAARLQRRKVDHILATGAEVVVTTNPGCLLQIQAGLKAAGSSVRAVHLADYLDQAISSKPLP